MKLTPEFLSELKMRNDIESIISPYVALKKRGSTLVGLCPFHNEKTGSFTVWPEKNSYYCFGCGAGGDVITFMMQIEHLDYIEAVKLLADKAGLAMPTDTVDDKAARLRSDIFEANKAAAKFFYEKLISEEGKQALTYLTGRGLLPKTIKQFGLGFAPDSWDAMTKHLNSLGFKDYVLDAAGLTAKTKAGKTIDRFRNRVMFPVMDIRGNFIAFSGRKLREEDYGGKYVNTSDTPVYKKSMNMFALNFAKNHCAKKAILVEGNMDVIALHQAGFPMTVAALGTAFTSDQARLLARYTDEVIVTMDADSAGKTATEKVLRILSDAGLKARVLRLPDCKDPDEYIKKNGAARFGALLDGAVNDIEYKLHEAASGLDLSLSDSKLEYLKRCCDILSAVEDGVATDLYSGKLSELCGVSKEAILRNIAEVQKKKKKQTVKKELGEIVRPTFSRDAVNPQKLQYPGAVSAEESIIALLIAHPDMFKGIRDRITADDFVTDFSKRVFSAVALQLQEGNSFDIGLLGGEFSPKEMGYISMLENTRLTGDDPSRAMKESIEMLQKQKLSASAPSASELSRDEWAERMNELAKAKIKRD